jgi:protein-disulfide isomerase
MNRIALSAASLLIALPLCVPVLAQTSAPPNTGTAFKDTSMLKPPPGARVAIYEFEDLECPACANAFPITRAAAEHYKIPLLHHDFPLHMHIWSLDAAITARYMQDKISPQAAEDFRRAVFASQNSIASKEDLQNFTRHYFQTHGREMPFVVDPTGQFAREVHADYELGERVGLTQTPTIFVVTPRHWVQVTDVSQLYQTIDTALAETPEVAASKMRHPAKKVQR